MNEADLEVFPCPLEIVPIGAACSEDGLSCRPLKGSLTVAGTAEGRDRRCGGGKDLAHSPAARVYGGAAGRQSTGRARQVPGHPAFALASEPRRDLEGQAPHRRHDPSMRYQLAGGQQPYRYLDYSRPGECCKAAYK